MRQVAWQSYGETRSYTDIAALHATGDINTTLPDKVVKELRRGYVTDRRRDWMDVVVGATTGRPICHIRGTRVPVLFENY